jgi:signal transduction histidine kinase/ligand-binding sensor domain-containing protein/DNA-binding response OmpR family regulator
MQNEYLADAIYNGTMYRIVLFFLLMVFTSGWGFTSASQSSLFRYYQKGDGLAGTYFQDFCHDSRGYLWIATQTGLSRFDGFGFYGYKKEGSDSTSLNSSHAQSLFEDAKGNLWVGTNIGLNRYNYADDNFERITMEHSGYPFHLAVKQILEDKNGAIWLITSNGLVRVDAEKLTYTFFNPRFTDNGLPGYVQFNQADFDPNGNLWIASAMEGLLVFNMSEQQFRTVEQYTGKVLPEAKHPFTVMKRSGQNLLMGSQKGDILWYDWHEKSFATIAFSNDDAPQGKRGIASVVTDRHGNTWVGMEYDGLAQLNTRTLTLQKASIDIPIENIAKSKVLCYIDRQGDLWLGLMHLGLYHQIEGFQPFEAITPKNNQLRHHLAKSMLLDRNGNLWVGSDGGGLSIRPKGQAQFTPIETFVPTGALLSRQAVMCLTEDGKGRIWIGTYLNGIFVYDPSNKTIKNVYQKTQGNPLAFNGIFDFENDAEGNIWVGTNGASMLKIDTRTDQITHIQQIDANGTPTTLNAYINDIAIDNDHTLWLATYNGFAAWNPVRKRYREFKGLIDKANDEPISAIKIDKNGSVWMASTLGLISYVPSTDSITLYTSKDGICDDAVMSLEIDDDGNIWVSTGNGLSMFNPKTNNFKRYYRYDGLPFNEFLSHASLKDAMGNLYFGGTNGLVRFNPKQIGNMNSPSRLVFSNLRILDQAVRKGILPNGRKILKTSLNETDTIVLEYADKSFSIDFGAIDFVAPEKIEYAVMLKGFDKTWSIRNHKQRTATYTNLNPGEYLLLVKSTNIDGDWLTNERQIRIIVEPPFWLRWWAFAIYFGAMAGVILLIRSAIVFRLTMKNELQLQQFESQKQETINKAKFNFFTNISHEIRTPLTMLMAPLHHLAQSAVNDEQKRYIGYVERNAQRLQRLINQLLDFQKVEASQMKLKALPVDMVRFTTDIVGLCESSANEKNIDLFYEPACDELEAWVDVDKMDKIIFNILANALKFTPPGGQITVIIKHSEDSFDISISDTGIGMSANDLIHIFDRFYQVDQAQSAQGTGIGLHLTKKLVELHHGTIQVTSEPNKGSSFTLRFPLGKQHLEPDEIGTQTPFLEQNVMPKPLTDFITHSSPHIDEPSKKLTLVCIEDDPEILSFLATDLGRKYHIVQATNGIDGWKSIVKHQPEVIVSDVMMPGMDGLALCNKVKTTLETSHIPIILLTARTAVEHQIEGLETGADAYITKPFHPSILKLTVERIIDSRTKLKERFAQWPVFVAKDITATSADEKFLQRAIDYVTENMGDCDLSIEKMCSDLSINRVQLYRKLKALTNQVPTEFIRIIRLKQAAALLTSTELNISEVAFRVGFNSHQYFTNSFQKHFNQSPTEYVQKNGMDSNGSRVSRPN